MLKRQNSLAFFIAYVQSLYKNITAPSVKTLFFSNKRCDEVLHTNVQVQHPRWLHLLQKQKQVMTLRFHKQNQKSNITTGQKSVVNRRHLRPTGQRSSFPQLRGQFSHVWVAVRNRHGHSVGRVHVSRVLRATLLSLSWSRRMSPCSSESVPVYSG